MAAFHLGDLGPEVARSALIEAVRDPYENVRKWAAYALGNFGPAAVSVLAEALRDADQQVCIWAAKSLGYIKDRAGVPQLLAVLRHPDPQRRIIAARALGEIGDAAAAPGLLDALRHPAAEARDRREVAQALGEIAAPDPALVAALEAVLEQDKDNEVRRSICWAIGEICAAAQVRSAADKATLQTGIRCLRKGGSDPSKLVRIQAREQLINLQLGGEEDLIELASPPEPDHVTGQAPLSITVNATAADLNYFKFRVAYLALTICRKEQTDTFSCKGLAEKLKADYGLDYEPRTLNNYLTEVQELLAEHAGAPGLLLFDKCRRQGFTIVPFDDDEQRQAAWNAVEQIAGRGGNERPRPPSHRRRS